MCPATPIHTSSVLLDCRAGAGLHILGTSGLLLARRLPCGPPMSSGSDSDEMDFRASPGKRIAAPGAQIGPAQGGASKRARVEGDDDAMDSSSSSSLSELHLSSSDQAPARPGTAMPKDDNLCIVCGTSLEGQPAEQRNLHVNRCVDMSSRAPSVDIRCQFCEKVVTHLTVDRRNAHVNRCADQAEQARALSRKTMSLASSIRAGTNDPIASHVYFCPICAKDLSAASGVARLQHVKSCAKKHDVGPEQLRERSEALRRDELLPAAAAAVAAAPDEAVVAKGGGPDDDLYQYHDPITGFTRKIGLQRNRAVPKRKTAGPAEDDGEPLQMDNPAFALIVFPEDLALALALSVSEVEMPSLQNQHLSSHEGAVDGAGFPASPTISQVCVCVCVCVCTQTGRCAAY